MYKKILLAFALLFFSLSYTSAHDFNEEAFSYILNNPDATWSDFEWQVATFEDPALEELMQDTQSKLTVALSITGKEYVMDYAKANPDFTYTDIKNLIWTDPMLTEIWVEVIYSYLSEKLQADTSYISWDYFVRFIEIWLTHILWWYDHILFILALIICLPRARRILSIITIFTIAHSVTIVLWWLQITSLPSTVVEAMILISIIIMAIYSIFQKVWEEKKLIPEAIIIFVLWLFHGLGFAWFFRSILDVTSNIWFPIFAFNIWVEIGQILVIIISLWLLHIVYKYLPKYKDTIKNILATLCIFASLFWIFLMFG